MVTSKQCLTKYGPATSKNKSLVLWEIPPALHVGCIPKRLYCNKDIIQPLSHAFKNLIDTGHVNELKTWDGCFNIRKMRGLASMSLHSWGVAVDVNAATNGLNRVPQLSPGFVKCFTDAGFDWGGTWTRKDGMHFQLHKI